MDGASDDIARCKLAIRMVVDHEGPATNIAQDAAFTAHCLGYKERGSTSQRQRGRMKLHEFEIHQLRSGAVGNRQSIAGGHCRIGGARVELSCAARRENHMIRVDLDVLSTLKQQPNPTDTPSRREERGAQCFFPDRHTRRPDRRRQSLFDTRPGRIASRMENTGQRVSRFQGKRKLLTVAIERHATLEEVDDTRRRLMGQNCRHPGVGQTVAGRNGIPQM
jgi:hypothetical protein